MPAQARVQVQVPVPVPVQVQVQAQEQEQVQAQAEVSTRQEKSGTLPVVETWTLGIHAEPAEDVDEDKDRMVMEHEVSTRGLGLGDEEPDRNMSVKVYPCSVDMMEIHKGPSPAGLEALHSAAHMSGRREETGIEEQHSTGDYNAGAGLGRHSPAIHRESPHFQRAPMEAGLDMICEARRVDVRVVYAGEMVYAGLLPVEALRAQVDVGGSKFEVATPNRKDGSRLKDILRSSSCHCRRVAQCLRIPDCRQPIPESLGIRGRRPLLRRSISQND